MPPESEKNFNAAHGSKRLRPIEVGEKAWIQDANRQGIDKEKSTQPRSYC